MKRTVFTGAALVTVVGVVVGAGWAGTKSAAYIGVWKAHVTKAQLLHEGIVDPRMPGTFKLELKGNGTYRTYNPLDGWSNGTYSANATRIVFSKDVGCVAGGLPGPGVYRWRIAQGRLGLTAVAMGSDPCGGRWQTLTIPRWRRG